MKKTETMTITQFNDLMMDDAYTMLNNAMKELNKATQHIEYAKTNTRMAMDRIWHTKGNKANDDSNTDSNDSNSAF